MLLYFVNGVASRGVLDAALVVPHPTLSLLASAWLTPTHVLITDAEGEFIADSPPQGTDKSNDKVTCMAWHPTQSILAIGWESGRLSAWSLPTIGGGGNQNETGGGIINNIELTPIIPAGITFLPQQPIEVAKALSQHGEGAVMSCVWSGAGNYLITSSNNKRMVAWTVENTASTNDKVEDDAISAVVRSNFAPLWSVPTESVIIHIVHVTSPSSVPIHQRALEQHQQQEEEDKLRKRSPQTLGLPPMAPARNENNNTSKDNNNDDECIFFLASSTDKRIYGLSEEQKLFTLINLDEAPTTILYDSIERQLVILTTTNIINVYHVSELFATKLLLRRKLSTPSPAVTTEKFTLTMQWAASGLLAFGCGDDRVRMFDIKSEAMYFIQHPALTTPHITYITTLPRKGVLAMATAEGPLAVFQRYIGNQQNYSNNLSNISDSVIHSTNNNNNSDPSEQWDLVTVVDIEGRVDRVNFTNAGHIIASLANGKLQVLRETLRKRAWDGVAAATQISMEMVVVESTTGCQCLLKSSSKILGMSVAFPIIGLWNGQQIDLYTVNESTSTASLTNFVPTTNSAFAVHPEGLFFVRDANRVVFVNYQLVTIGQIAFTEAEGTPIIVDLMGDVVVAISSTNAMRLARVYGRELRSLGPPRKLPLTENGIIVTDAKVNAQGRRVALMTRRIIGDQPDSRIWVYDADTDHMSSFDFAIRGETPIAVYWNTPEPNSSTIGELGYLLLACETHQVRKIGSQQQQQQQQLEGIDIELEEATNSATKSPQKKTPQNQEKSQNQQQHQQQEEQQNEQQLQQQQSGSVTTPSRKEEEEALANEAMPDLENFAEKKQRMDDEKYMSGFSGVNPFAHRTHSVVTLFATNKGLIVHNGVVLKRYHICLVGLTIPDFLLASVRINGNPSNPEDYMIEQKRLRDFEGLKTEKDAAVLEALMKFSYYSTIGNMDEAYRCVKTIKSSTVWQSLAKMCVYSGRLDVAGVCLAQMQDGVAASALREACTRYPGEKEVHLATLACSLGLIKESENLLRKAKRYDLITDLLVACGKFEQAQKHARRYDRIRSFPVAYKYAQFMESFSNYEAAIMWYFNARCLSTDVARIYFQSGRLSELRELVLPPSNKGKDRPATGNLTATTSSNALKKNEGNNNSDNISEQPSAIARSTTPALDTPEKNDLKDEEQEVRATFERLFFHNKDLLIWWAKHSERRRQISESLKYYTLAEDTFNVVRLLCSDNPPRIEEAIEIVDKAIQKNRTQANGLGTTGIVGITTTSSSLSNDMEPVGAAYFIGLHYERLNEVSTALQYYRYAGAWRAAARVAKTHQRYGELMNISLISDDERLMLDSATYLEQNNAYDKAVELYHRIGDVQKAIDVCIKGGLYDTMHRISTTLNAQSDPEVFLQMASHFVDNGHYNKAAEMFIFAKAFPRALELCTERNVPLTDEMAEAMTSDANCRDLTEEQRNALQRQIAGIAKDQGNWNLACKKYTQIGERVKALKMLMRGGDVAKVIFFANHSRNTEIYTLAGNFLQSQNWDTDSNIYKHIVLFYSKAKAFSNLISFTDAYAQMQIDENRNYYEAWRALDECVHLLEKNRDAVYGGGANIMAKEESIRVRRDFVALVVKALKLLANSVTDNTQATELIAVCSDLIKRSRPSHQDHNALTAAIRIGDVFALLVRYYYENAKAPQDALRVMESMVKHGVEPKYFVERDLLQLICSATGRRAGEFIDEENTGNQSVGEGRGGKRRSSIASELEES